MSDSESDWFNKSDETLLQDLQNTITRNTSNDNQTEYITAPTTSGNYMKRFSVKPTTDNSIKNLNKRHKSIFQLESLSNMNNLDVFLYVHSYGRSLELFRNEIQLGATDRHILLYTNALAAMCKLELPGFHKTILQLFSENELFLNQVQQLLSKMYSDRFPGVWIIMGTEVLFLENIELLLLESFNHGLLDRNGIELMHYILLLIRNSKNHSVKSRSVSEKLERNLSLAVTTEKLYGFSNLEIYPSLEELAEVKTSPNSIIHIQCPTRKYVTKNMQFLEKHFLHPLRRCIELLKNDGNLKKYPQNKYFLLENVYIIVNRKYLNSKRCKFTFVDVWGESRPSDTKDCKIPAFLSKKLDKLKSGSLLCFSTSKQFENIICVVVTYTDPDCLRKGYVGIEVIKQLNIGNIYNCPLLMLECPLFFEPYNHVYNYLRNCNITNFPMKKYIIDHEINAPRSPNYLESRTVYKFERKKFYPLVGIPSNVKDHLKLNDDQFHAFCTAIKQEFTLIQGPPGTGKTYLSVQLIKCLIENVPKANKPIVLVAYTNDSLDNILLKLSTYTDRIARFGSQCHVAELSKFCISDIPDNGQMHITLKKLHFQMNQMYKTKFQELENLYKMYDGTMDTSHEISQLRNDLNNIQQKLHAIKVIHQYYMVRHMDIIAMTTTFAAKVNFLFKLLKSSIVIFEDANEILECHAVACLTEYTKHVIMVGDHEQLKPFTWNSPYKRKHVMNCSLFEKLYHLQESPIILKTQYRMHPNLAELLVPTIYKELSCDTSVWEYPTIRKMLTNLYFLQHECVEYKYTDDNSLCNEYKVEEILHLTQHLLINACYCPNDIVILSPFIKQVKSIKQQFRKHSVLNGLKVCTVDSFQRLEANIVILSLVHCNSLNEIGWLAESNRICVALSRAKWAQYIIGDLKLLSKCSLLWYRIAEKLEIRNATGSKFPVIT